MSQGNTVVKGAEHVLGLQINQTDLLAGTTQYLYSPVTGYLTEIMAIVQTAVTTGGAIKAQVAGSDVAGASVTVADGATAGTVYSARATFADSSRSVKKGDNIGIVPAAAFATAGAVNVSVRVIGGDVGSNNDIT